jgi:hypothetical protein
VLKKKCAIEIWFKSQANNLYMVGVNGVLEVDDWLSFNFDG